MGKKRTGKRATGLFFTLSKAWSFVNGRKKVWLVKNEIKPRQNMALVTVCVVVRCGACSWEMMEVNNRFTFILKIGKQMT